MPKYLDENGLLYFWQKIKAVFSSKAEGVKTITRSGTTFTVTRADDTTFTFTQQDNTVAKTTTTPKANGTAAIGSETKYAAGDHVHPLQTTISGNAGTATTLQTARTIDGVSFNGSANIIHFGTSSSAASATTKTVDCTGFTLATGAWIAVKFSVTNTGAVGSLKLNVNSTGEKAIKYRGSNLPAANTLSAGRVYLFVYDGTNYELIGDLNTTYTAASATPLMDGTGAVGTSSKYAREDHVHPSDTTKVDKVDGKGLSTNDYTTADKNKLAGISTGAEVNQNAFSNVKVGSTTVAADTKTDTIEFVAGTNVTLTPDATNDKITISASNTEYNTMGSEEAIAGTATTGKLISAAVLKEASDWHWSNGFSIEASPMDTGEIYINVYHGTDPESEGDPILVHSAILQPADGSNSGIMTYAMYNKLNGIAAGAEVNQNAFSNVKVGSTTVAADGKTDTLELVAGSNVTLTPDATNDKVTIAATDTVTTVASTTGSGNAVTAISASNGALTVTKGSTFIESSAKGAANGVCPLNANSVIDSQYLPSFVDDVVEAYPRSGQTELSSTWLATGSASGTVITPQTGVIYVLMADSTSYGTNSQFRWTGSAYVKLNDGGVSAITNAEIDTILAA